MMQKPTQADLPPQLRHLAIKAEKQPEALRDAVWSSLLVAPPDATQEHVLVDACTRLGYLPDEAERAIKRLLAEPPGD